MGVVPEPYSLAQITRLKRLTNSVIVYRVKMKPFKVRETLCFTDSN